MEINIPSGLANVLKKIEPKDLVPNSEPLYTEQQILMTQCLLARQFRRICVDKRITYSQFVYLYKTYGKDVLDKPDKKLKEDINNLKRTLYRDTLTWKKFREFCTVLGIPVIQLSTLHTENGKLIKY